MLPPQTAAPDALDGSEPTWASVLGGDVRFLQPAQGYRVNQDSVLLAAFAARGRAADVAVDLGAGVGVIGLVLHRLGAAKRLALVDRDPEAGELARRNLAAMGVPGEVFAHDLSSGLPSELVHRGDVVVMNPPFFAGEQHQSEHPSARAARHGELSPFLAAARAALAGSRARAAIVYPARSLAELFDAARLARLTPKRLRLVYPFLDRPARLALVELRLGKRAGLEVEPPFVEWERPGVPTAELARLSVSRTDDRT